MSTIAVRLLFVIAGLYDFAIGIAFVGFGPVIYEALNVTPPNHWGYVQFGALLLAIFGCMFIAVAVRPHSNRNLIPYGVLLKISYVGIVAYYWVTSDLPMMFKPFAVIDGVMLVLFVMAYGALRSPQPR